jgi:hypothetical protein
MFIDLIEAPRRLVLAHLQIDSASGSSASRSISAT